MVRMIFPKIDLTAIKGVLIDLDNTIYCYENSHQKALIKCFNVFQEKIDNSMSFKKFEESYLAYRKKIKERLYPTASCRSRLLAFQIWFEELNIELPYSQALEFEDCYWDHLIDSIEPCKEAIKFLEQCNEKNIRVCIVTDMTTREQMKKIQKLKIEALISGMVTSEEAGCEKPDPLIYTMALMKLRTNISETIMVGDDLIKDIEGAKKIGLKTYTVEIL